MTFSLVSAEHAARPAHEGRFGIIDIGSNSIRLVIYDGLKRAPLPLFNEKLFCGLGKGLAVTGKLNPEGVKLAYDMMTRFLAMARLMDVVELDVLATAAVRDAKDGQDFIDRLEKQHGIHINLISGKREARLTAMGVLSSMHEPDGLCGDLGGGSMELCGIANGKFIDQATLPIGSLRLIDEGKGNRDKTRKALERSLKEAPWLKKSTFTHFYAIGGSFRALAKLHMQRSRYPLNILHHYTVDAKDILSLAKEISKFPAEELAALPGVSAKRANALLPAALVLETLIKRCHIRQIVFSACGIREGFLYEKLSPHLRKEDGLISGCADLAAQYGVLSGYGRELFAWMQPLFKGENEAQARVRLAACLLSEIGGRIHPEYRAEWAMHTALQSSLTGFSHSERVTLALALYHRYQYKPKSSWKEIALVDESQRSWARLWGVAANLAYHLSAGECGHLDKAVLEIKKGKGLLRLKPELQDVAGDAVRKRVDGLGLALKAFSSRRK